MTRQETINKARLKGGGSMKPLIRVVQEPNRTLAIKTGKGYVHAITYAKGMTASDIQASFIANPPTKTDWRPFNESTGEYA